MDEKRTKAPKKGGWRRWLAWLGLAAAGGVLVWLAGYVRKSVDLGAVLARMHPFWLLCAVLVVPLVETVDALIFYSMGRRSGQEISFFGCFSAVFVGELYYRLGPAGAPVQLGLMVDAGYTPAAAGGVYTWKSLANTVIYTFFALAALGCTVGSFGAALGCTVGSFGGRTGWVTGVLAGVLTGYVGVCAVGFWAAARPTATAALAKRVLAFLTKKVRWLQRHDRGRRAASTAAEYCEALGRARENQELLWRMFLGMFVELLLLFSVPAYLYFGLGLQGTSFLQVTLTTCLVMLLARLVALPGNAVGAEGAFFFLMSPYFGGATTVALVLWRLLTFALPVVMGAGASALGALRRRWNFSVSP